MLEPFSQHLPEYYFHISKMGMLRLVNCPSEIQGTTIGFFRLLRQKHRLAAKLFIGSRGTGFYKLSYENNGYLINNQLSSKIEIEKMIENWMLCALGYLVTEYIKPHQEFAKIWPDAPNTLRITMVRRSNHSVDVGFALARFGTKKSGIVDNTYAGGIACIVDPETGYYSKGYHYECDKLIELTTHPDTGSMLEGVIPFWHEIIRKLQEILDYLPQLNFLGFDVAVIENGFKIIEINAQPNIEFIQAFIPINKNEIMRDYFQHKLYQNIIRIKNGYSRSFAHKIVARLRIGIGANNTSANINMIKSSSLFNEEWYLKQNPDLDTAHTDPASHYLLSGGLEVRDPGPDFNSRYYLYLYEDVKRAGINPLLHYLKYGKTEGRAISKH